MHEIPGIRWYDTRNAKKGRPSEDKAGPWCCVTLTSGIYRYVPRYQIVDGWPYLREPQSPTYIFTEGVLGGVRALGTRGTNLPAVTTHQRVYLVLYICYLYSSRLPIPTPSIYCMYTTRSPPDRSIITRSLQTGASSRYPPGYGCREALPYKPPVPHPSIILHALESGYYDARIPPGYEVGYVPGCLFDRYH